MRTTAMTMGACVLAAAALAGERKERRIELAVAPPGGEAFMIHGPIEGFEAKVVKGAPYSAESVTETTQALADGNRIVRSRKGSVARDSEGRTRREQMLGALGPFLAEKAPRAVFLNDPVSGVHYVLEPDEKVARKMPAPPAWHGKEPRRHVRFEKRVVVNGAEIEDIQTETAGEAEGATPAKESLGEKTIEGVTVEGTRTVTTIPAGSIGNERPLEIVSERWFSPQLQVVVMSRHADPRYGETVYRLTNINRDEPEASLFTVPADYSVKEAPPGDVVKIIRRHRQD